MHIAAAALIASLFVQVLPLAGRSTVRGRVFDSDGQPMRNVEMRALVIGTERQFVGGSAMTDADGRFSIERVPAGRILLRAQPHWRPPAVINGAVKRFSNPAPAYFPGVVALLDAWPIEVGTEEIIELDFHMPVITVGSIKARVTGPDGYLLDQLRVIRPEANQIKNVKIDADGIGHAEELREGRHIVLARGHSEKERLVGHAVVYISAGEHPVDVALTPATRITGRVVSDRGGIPPLGNMRVTAAWTDGTIDLDPLARDEGAVAADGSFTIDGLFGTRAIRVTGVPDGWELASIRHGRADVTTSTIDLAAGDAAEVVVTLTRR